MATTKKTGSQKTTASRVKSAAKSATKKIAKAAKAPSRPATVKLQLSAEDQARAIECLQKNGTLSITLNAAQLIKVPVSKRIISRDCAWLID